MAGQQWEFCFKRILTRKGAYGKHIRFCSSQQQTAPVHSSNSQSKALNPLLSIFCNETQLSDKGFNVNGLSSSLLDDNYNTDESSSTDLIDINRNINDDSNIHLTILATKMFGHEEIQQTFVLR
jgi:hypothetical protein